MFLKRAGVIGIVAATVVALSATAANASIPPPPGGGSWDLTAKSSSGGATTYAMYNSQYQPTLIVVCDTKADGHHAEGTLQQYYGGSEWEVMSTQSAYGGYGDCETMSIHLDTGLTSDPTWRISARTFEGSTAVDSIGYAEIP